MKKNKVYHLNFLDNDLPDKCAQLIIADPPYYKVKGDFDFIWKTFDDYLEDVEKWAKECKRVLADNGTLFWYGHAKKIAYSQVILDKYFELENNITWDKPDSFNYQYHSIENSRSFISNNERCLMYSNGIEPAEYDQTGWDKVKKDISNFQPLRNYFEGLQGFIGLNLKAINTKLGHRRSEHAFYWKSTQWDLPTESTYNQLIEVFYIDSWEGFKEYEELRQEYEELRQEYEELRQEYEYLWRPFNNHLRLSDVMKFSQESHITRKYDHDTIKPEALTNALITTCSREEDLVIVPFAGSGTECAISARNKRDFIGFEIDEKHVKTASDRASKELRELKLF